MVYCMMYACLEWSNVSTKTVAGIGHLLNRGTGMFKMSFKLFLQKKKKKKKGERTVADGQSSMLHLTHFSTIIKFSLLK